MAQPISPDLKARDPRDELRTRLEQAPADHAEAILAGYEVLQCLHEQGVLELLRGGLSGKDKIIEAGVEAINTPETVRGILNVLIMARVLGTIDPELLEKFVSAVPDALVGAAKAQQSEPPGIWSVLNILRGRNLRRGLAVVNCLLDGWGRNFSAGKAGDRTS